uniref:Uncharacterized protein n=1 Tax=Glossina pallidipes TaxID=7398 RepID=A0A1A9ZIS3_GLOPL
MNSDHNVCMDPLLKIKNLINAALKKKDEIFLIIVMHASSKNKYIKIMPSIRHTGSSQQLTKICCDANCLGNGTVNENGSVLERANFVLNVINSSKVYSEGLQLTSDSIFKSWCIVFLVVAAIKLFRIIIMIT